MLMKAKHKCLLSPKKVSVNAMMNKESVKQRIHREGEGISFTEFAYSLLQSYDFVQLNFHYDCILQVGGSDQWGNITAGVELVRRLNQANVHALTLPLLVKADGSKFGKTESGAVWLDAKKTSPYQFYQFWLKVPDTNVYRYLRMFSFLSLEEIEAIRHQDQHSEHKPQAQQILAEEMTCLIHGKEALVAAKRISYSLFTAGYDTLTEKDFTDLALDGLPHFAVRNGMSLIEALTISGLAKSNNEARRFIAQHAVLLNGTLVKDHERLLSQDDQRYGKYAILQRGKRSHVLLVWR
ncbi:MAG: tyrosine--tRNA ligase [Francisella sp.]|nr:MAG: tyrosine--tRNA ligase [Francisella sp.]